MKEEAQNKCGKGVSDISVKTQYLQAGKCVLLLRTQTTTERDEILQCWVCCYVYRFSPQGSPLCEAIRSNNTTTTYKRALPSDDDGSQWVKLHMKTSNAGLHNIISPHIGCYDPKVLVELVTGSLFSGSGYLFCILALTPTSPWPTNQRLTLPVLDIPLWPHSPWWNFIL